MSVAAYDVVRANAPYRAEMAAGLEAVLDAGQLILGPSTAAFEREFAGYCQAAHCVGVGNGLDALAITLRALGVGAGDEVVVPAFTFAATWFAATQLGAIPVPVDVGHDGMINADLVPAAITPRTRAIVPVHLFGALADMDAILAAGERFDIPVIEDAAQAHGAARGGRRAGSFGTAAAFSFYPTKNLGALGDGGAVCPSDAGLAGQIRRLRNYGSDQKYRHEVPGQNSRLDEVQAAFLLAKLPGLDAANARRREIAQTYTQRLKAANLAELDLPASCPSSVWHQFVFFWEHRDLLQSLLAEQGVSTLVHYPIAPFDQPCFAGQYRRDDFPVATALARKVLSLPMGAYLTELEVDHVARAVIHSASLLGDR